MASSEPVKAPVALEPEAGPLLIGRRLREAREARGLGVRTLAKRLAVSASLISQVERGKVMPSVATLYAIVRELDVSMDDLFFAGVARGQDRRDLDHGPVLRADLRELIHLASGVRWERLTVEPDAELDFQFASYEPGAESCPSDALKTHAGKEFGYVLAGRLRITIDRDTYDLGPGDSVSFASTTPHRLANAGTEPARAIWVVIGRERPRAA